MMFPGCTLKNCRWSLWNRYSGDVAKNKLDCIKAGGVNPGRRIIFMDEMLGTVLSSWCSIETQHSRFVSPWKWKTSNTVMSLTLCSTIMNHWPWTIHKHICKSMELCPEWWIVVYIRERTKDVLKFTRFYTSRKSSIHQHLLAKYHYLPHPQEKLWS